MRSVDRESDHKTILRIVLSDEYPKRQRRAGAGDGPRGSRLAFLRCAAQEARGPGGCGPGAWTARLLPRILKTHCSRGGRFLRTAFLHPVALPKQHPIQREHAGAFGDDDQKANRPGAMGCPSVGVDEDFDH